LNTRAIAADILVEVVLEGRSLTHALDPEILGALPPKDRTFVQAVCYGVLRFYWRLNAILSLLTRKPIKDERIRMLTLVGLYQIAYMRVAEHAAVSETVSATLNDAWAKPLINAILRNFQRNRVDLEAKVNASPSQSSAHPQWLYDKIRRDWPQHVTGILEANNSHPPMTLRVNRQVMTREAWLQNISQSALTGIPVDHVPCAVTLGHAVPTEMIPGFNEGHISVQDAAAQLAPTLMDLKAGQRILDLCAAPGGKTCHILETCTDLAEIIAVDIDESRMNRVRANLDRLQLQATLVTGDALDPSSWWDGRAFDRILVDAPCSATGVIRRHPDIKLLRKPQDIQQLANTQKAILDATWPMLEVGGRLLYATCSLLREENSAVIDRFLSDHSDAREIMLPDYFGLTEIHGRQVLPGMNGMDGFYYAAIVKDAP
jgi:16S rRNA (cytosine967-C5)-methyltransferase